MIDTPDRGEFLYAVVRIDNSPGILLRGTVGDQTHPNLDSVSLIFNEMSDEEPRVVQRIQSLVYEINHTLADYQEFLKQRKVSAEV